MKRLGFSLAGLILVADQAVKYWVTAVLGLQARGIVPLLPFLELTWVGNTGVSMGLLRAETAAQTWLLVGVTLVIAGGVSWWIARERSQLDVVALGLVLGGALGNIVDRVRLGHVVDFLDFFWRNHHFYVFNLADAAITVGVGLLLLRSLLAPAAKPV